MKSSNATNVRKNFQEIIDHVHYTKEAFLISKNGKPWVMVQPLSEKDKDLEKIIKSKSRKP